MIHERFDLAHWQRVLAAQPQAPCLVGDSPLQVARLEQRRLAVFPAGPPGARLPTDVFVFALGEPAQREQTKVGGLPYWPRSRPWPRSLDGAPMTFICQFCFADSRDIVGTLPGDVLLLFGREEGPDNFDPDAYHLAWLPLGETDLVQPAEIPATDWLVTPCYGVIHRTWDSPEVALAEDNDESGQHVDWHDLGVARFTKIGGLSFWSQEGSNPQHEREERYLCTSSSSWSGMDPAWPLLNVEQLFRYGDPTYQHLLMWGDVGQPNFFLRQNGEVCGYGIVRNALP